MRAAILVFLVACSGTPAPAPAEPAPPAAEAAIPEVVTTAAAAAKAIAQNPDDAARILADRGLTEDRFEEMLYEIAANPAWTREYERLRK